MAKKKRSFKQALTEFLAEWDEDDDGDLDDDDDQIVLRGPSARKFLGLLDDDKPPAPAGDDPAAGDDPPAEPKPQRGHSKYFGEK